MEGHELNHEMRCNNLGCGNISYNLHSNQIFYLRYLGNEDVGALGVKVYVLMVPLAH